MRSEAFYHSLRRYSYTVLTTDELFDMRNTDKQCLKEAFSYIKFICENAATDR